MIEKTNNELSIVKQCKLLEVCRSTLYYKPEGQKSDFNLEIMAELDKRYLLTPFYRRKKRVAHLGSLGIDVNIKRVRRLMQLMDLKTIYKKPNKSLPNKEHEKYPYLFKDLIITHRNQVWATDITYIPVHRGFMYLMAVVDLYSRKVLNWSVSNTMDTDWCTEVLNQTIALNGTPEIFNTDQASTGAAFGFTSETFTKALKDNNIKISRDGKGRAIDNIFVERLWRTVK
jgi:putative transposase